MPTAIVFFAGALLILAGLIFLWGRGNKSGAQGQPAGKRRFCFRHDMALHDDKAENESWSTTDRVTHRQIGSNYNRVRRYTVNRCTKCGLETAGTYLADDKGGTWQDITVDYALKNMGRIRGIGKGVEPKDKEATKPEAPEKDDPCIVPLIPEKEG